MGELVRDPPLPLERGHQGHILGNRLVVRHLPLVPLLREFVLANTKPTYMLVDTDDLSKLYIDIIEKTKRVDPCVRFYGCHIEAFKHPVTGQIISAFNDYEPRREFFHMLQEYCKPPYIRDINIEKFTNQTWTQLTKSLYMWTCGASLESVTLDTVEQLMRKYPTNMWIQRRSECDFPVFDIRSFDLKKAFSDVM